MLQGNPLGIQIQNCILEKNNGRQDHACNEMLNYIIRDEAVYAALLDWKNRMSGLTAVTPGGLSE